MTVPSTTLLDGKTPEKTLEAFCQTYTQEETQHALWQCLQPRLLQLASRSPGEGADRQLALYGHLEQLIAVLYELPPSPG